MPISKIQANSLAANAVASAPGKNLIINGAMQVAQRGTSSTSSGYGSVDRFSVVEVSTDELAWTQTQQSVTDLAGFTNSYRITTTTAESAIAADELFYVTQRIEAQNLQQLAYGTSSAKQVTLSFYVKSSVTGTFSTNLYQVDDTRIVNSEYTISSANTWERKEITYAADQTGVIDNDNGTGFYVTWNLALGSNWKGNAATAWEAYNTDNWAGAGTYTDAVITTANATWEITGVQLEVGGTATDFEHRSYGEELALCQRYYQTLTLLGTSYSAAIAYTGGSNAVLPTTNFSTMRAAPTVTFNSSGNIEYYSGSAWVDTTVSVQDTTDNYTVFVALSAGPSGVTRGSLIRADQGTPMNALLDAEL